MNADFHTLQAVNVSDFADWTWEQIAPYYEALASLSLAADNVDAWLKDWTLLKELIGEAFTRIEVGTTLDTTDKALEDKMIAYLENIKTKAEVEDNRLKEKLLGSGLEPAGFTIPLRNMRSDADLFRKENLPLFVEESKLSNEYARIIGAQTVDWDGEERTLYQLQPFYRSPDRALREKAWRAEMERRTQDRQTLNALWGKFLDLRQQIAHNAGLANYRDFIWRRYYRFDYTPEDCERFHDAIEQVVVPAVERLNDKRRQKLNLETLRPWDDKVDPSGENTLHPYDSIEELEAKSNNIFNRVDAELGEYFQTMRTGGLLNLPNRKGKAPGGYCTSFARDRRPFIFMNAVGIHDDVQTLLHEAGHCFHVFESAHLPYVQQMDITSEIAEVASMSMELLAMPYLESKDGGFYSTEDANRARAEHLEANLRFWPYMAVVDAFQHWVYTHTEAAHDAAQCDAKWGELWDRFMRGIDWSGLEVHKQLGWQRKLHIFQAPFYYIEYGLAQLGATQVWANALKDQHGAVAAYRHALSLGGTRRLPELFEAANVKLAFDADTLGRAVELTESTLDRIS